VATEAEVHALLEELFAAPFERFALTRKDLARRLRAAGDRDKAAAVEAAKRPTRGAWALNQVARRHASELAAFVSAAEGVREAQKRAVGARDAGAVRAAGSAMNAAIAKVVALAEKAIESDGAKVSAPVARAIVGTLRAVPFLPAGEVTRLTEGTLVADLEPPDELSVLGAVPAGAEPPTRKEASAAKADEERRREEAKRGKAEAAKRERALAKLEETAVEAEREAARLDKAWRAAAERARELGDEARRAQATAIRARAEVEKRR
jgi:hypothetical protein